jgi:hypothetical protein
MQSQHLAGLGDLEDQGFAIAGSGGHFNPTFAQQVDATRHLAFHKQH